jgi:hypothetical protein
MERGDVLVCFHLFYLAREQPGTPVLTPFVFVSTLCTFDLGPSVTVPLYWQYLSEPRTVGEQDPSRGWFMRCIEPSPCLFVCVVTDRVGQTLFEYEPSLNVCRVCVWCVRGVSRVWCVCLCSSRALPVVFPVVRRICPFGVFELSL